MVRIVADPGSCHMQNKEYCFDFINLASECGTDVKFQLFKDLPPNLELPRIWFQQLVEYGKKRNVEVFASVFDEEALNLLRLCKCKSVKFAFSQQNSSLIESALEDFENVFISCGVMDEQRHSKATYLFCDPTYPVRYKIAFEGIASRFQGYSHHALGIGQALSAVQHGIKLVEVHSTLHHKDIDCADSKFALSPDELRELCRHLRRY